MLPRVGSATAECVGNNNVVGIDGAATEASARRRGRLGGHADFRKLWVGQTISLFGSLIGRFALPLVAIQTLQAGPFAVAALGAAGVAPGLLFGLFAGVWVDRLRRRPILIGADVGRALLYGSIPLAAVLGLLRIEWLLVVAFLGSLLTLSFDLAHRAYLPSLVGRENLVEGNSKLEASGSVAEVAGFGLAGILVQALTAPIAILIDALSFVASAASIGLIRAREGDNRAATAVDAAGGASGALREIAEGLRLLRADPVLRAIAGANGADLLFIHLFVAVLMLFLVEELRLPPALIGIIFGVGGVSAFFGALLAERLTARWGLGRTMIGAFLAYRLMTFFVAVAGGPVALAATLLIMSQSGDAAHTVYRINQVSLLQKVVPDHLLGRVNASIAVVEQAAMVIGLLLGGWLGETIGLRPTIIIGITGALLATLWLAKVRNVK